MYYKCVLLKSVTKLSLLPMDEFEWMLRHPLNPFNDIPEEARHSSVGGGHKKMTLTRRLHLSFIKAINYIRRKKVGRNPLPLLPNNEQKYDNYDGYTVFDFTFKVRKI